MAKSKYTVLHQDDTHFLMRHPDGSDFRVAKRMIDPVTRMEIQKLAEGGEVQDPATDNLDPAKVDAASAVADFTGSPAADLEGTIPNRELASAPPAPKLLPPSSQVAAGDGTGQIPDSVAMPGAPDRDMTAGGEGQAPSPRTAASTPSAPVPTAPLPAPGKAPVPATAVPQAGNALNDYQRQELKGAQEKAQAETDAGKATAALYGDVAKRLTAADEDFQTTHKMYNARSEQLMQEIASSKVDPNHYWESKSAGGKVSAAIGIVLAGLGGGLNRTGSNMALDTINKAIDRDIDAQKSNLANKNSLLNHNLNLTHNLESAMALTKSNMLAIATAQAGKIAGENAGPMAKANLDMLQGQLKRQFMGENFELAKRQALSKFMSGAGGDSNLPLLFSGDVKAEQFVQLPNGQLKLANSPDDAKKVRETQTQIGTINDMVQQLKAFRTKHGATIPGSAANAEASRLQQNLVLEYGKLANLARFTPAEEELYKKQVPNPGILRGDKFEDAIKNLEELSRSKLEQTHRNYIMGYKPVKTVR